MACGCYRYFTGFIPGSGDGGGGLPPFIDQSLIPTLDAYYDLGRNTPTDLRWNAVYAMDGVFTTSFTVPILQGQGGGGGELQVRSDVIPSDPELTLGTATSPWGASHTARVVTGAIGTETGSELLVETDVLPSAPGLNLGSDTSRFANVYAVTSRVTTMQCGTVLTGTLGARATDPFLRLIDTVEPSVTDELDLGSDAKRFRAVYATELDAPTAVVQALTNNDDPITLKSVLVPAAEGQVTLGTNESPFGIVHASYVSTANLGNDGPTGYVQCVSDMSAFANASLGYPEPFSAVRATSIQTEQVTVNAIGSVLTNRIGATNTGLPITLQTSLEPQGTVDLGTDANRFRDVYATTVRATNGQFDTLTFEGIEDLNVGSIGALSTASSVAIRDPFVPQAPTATLGTEEFPFDVFASAIDASSVDAVQLSVANLRARAPATTLLLANSLITDPGVTLGLLSSLIDAVYADTVHASTLRKPDDPTVFALTLESADGDIDLNASGRILHTADTVAFDAQFADLSLQEELYASARNILIECKAIADTGDVRFRINGADTLVIDGSATGARFYPTNNQSSIGKDGNAFEIGYINQLYTYFLNSTIGQIIINNPITPASGATIGTAAEPWPTVYATAVVPPTPSTGASLGTDANKWPAVYAINGVYTDVRAGAITVSTQIECDGPVYPKVTDQETIGKSTNWYTDVYTATVRHPNGSLNLSSSEGIIIRASDVGDRKILMYNGTKLLMGLGSGEVDVEVRQIFRSDVKFDGGCLSDFIPRDDDAVALGSVSKGWSYCYSYLFPPINALVAPTDAPLDENTAMDLVRNATIRSNARVTWIDNVAAAASAASYTTNDPGELRTLVSLLAGCVKQLDARVTALETAP